MHNFLKWLIDGNTAHKTFELKGTTLDELTNAINTYTTERNWTTKSIKSLYDDALNVTGKSFYFWTDISTLRCRVKLIATIKNNGLEVGISSRLHRGRPKGDPNLNQRIVDGVESYLKLLFQ